MFSRLNASAADEQGIIDGAIQRFKDSEIRFQRGRSNVPLFPLAFLNTTHYGDADLEDSTGRKLSYDVDTVSQGATIPFLLGDRDMLVVGEYLSVSRFSADGAEVDDFTVRSAGIPLVWLRQVNSDWQAAAFVMPLGHDSDLDDSNWSWQTLGGGFTRWEQRDDLWWAFGFYFDVGSDEDFYIPYLGASWTLNERWTISAIMPWPAVIYSPTSDWLFRLGASPSGASWSLEGRERDVHFNVDAWDFGLSIERRLHKHIWLGAEAGVGGLRGFRVSEEGFDAVDVEVGSSAFFGIKLTMRPELF